ncbi:MAG TPA: DNA polymerase III subunit gamma/tau [Reyranella sp.]|nr:DNA polymerase III subunit gamma/tau [Reyranella sp.]
MDEVHMLSKAAFNGLLKTLEEPPAHVKFVFATTEIRRVPVTVLSRCQRFDLRRVEAAILVDHLAAIAAKEGVEAEPQALRQIARAAEGSVRDALSILDQAIAHGAGKVDATTVQDMLGLADRARTVDLFEHVMKGDTAAALAELQAQHDSGADPAVVLTDLADFTHYVTRLKLAPEAASRAAVSETERLRGAAFAESLSIRVLSRTWQMLVKGIQEVAQAPRSMTAADMVLVRLCHAADLPTPDEALRLITENGGAAMQQSPAARMATQLAPPQTTRGGNAQAAQRQPRPDQDPRIAPELRRFEDVIALAKAERDIVLANALERWVRPVRFEPGQIEIALTPEAHAGLPQQLGQKLQEWTGRRWIVVISKEQVATETAREARERSRAELFEEIRGEPLVKQLLERFPGAEIVSVRERPVAPLPEIVDEVPDAPPATEPDED